VVVDTVFALVAVGIGAVVDIVVGIVVAADIVAGIVVAVDTVEQQKGHR